MARKRKTRASEAAEEPEIVPPAEPKPELEPEPEPEPAEPVVEVEAEVKIEDAEPAETEQTVAEAEAEGEEEEEVEEEEEEEVEEEEAEGEEEPDNMEEEEEHEEDVPQPGGEIDEKPSENAVAENGGGSGATEGENEEGEEEFEEEDVERLLEPFSKDQLTLLIKEAIGKHPDLAEIVHKMADSDPAHCKIFVHGLGWEANTETITSVFEKYGEIEDCKVVRDKNTGKSKGYGFILFRHRSGARRALKEPQKLIEGRMTSCQLASAGPVQTPIQPAAVATVSTPPTSEYTQRKIYVSNVSAELEPKKLSEFFSKFGEIEEGPLGLDKMTGKPRGFCLFVYRSVESARKALEEPHKNFEGQILHCQKAIDGPKHSKGYFNQQHGGQSQQQPQQQHQSHHHHHHQGHQGYYNHPAKKGRYAGSAGVGHTGGHLMAPSAGPAVPSVGFNPAVAPAAIGQAVAALLATQGAGLGIGNLLGGMGGGVNPQGVPPMMNNAGYGGQGGPGGYGGQPGMQGGYGGQQQMGQGGVRPHQGGAPYMGHGH